MAQRRPLILDSGLIKELPLGDDLVGFRQGPPGFDGETPEPMMIPGPQGPTGPQGPAGPSGSGGSGSTVVMFGDEGFADQFPCLHQALNIAAGLEVDAGTDGSKFLTPASIAASKNVPHVAPGTSGNILSSNGTDWTSQAPSAIGGVPSGIFAKRRSPNTEDDDFEETAFNAKWTKTNSAATENYDDLIRSAYVFDFASAGSDVTVSQAYTPGSSNFSLTLCFQTNSNTNNHNVTLQAADSGGANIAEVQMIYSSGITVRSVKFVSSSFSQLNTTGALTGTSFPFLFIHVQRSAANTWDFYYSYNGIVWTSITTGASITITVAKINISFGTGGAAAKVRHILHWIRRDWITLP